MGWQSDIIRQIHVDLFFLQTVKQHYVPFLPFRLPPYGVDECWFEHVDLSLGNGFMTSDYEFGTEKLLNTNLYS